MDWRPISADSHITEPPNCYVDHIDPAWRDKAPHVVNKEGLGDIYVVDGMNFTPSTPAYEDMRDGILASVANGPRPGDCRLVWRALAEFGIGVGAQGTVTADGVAITESFDVPVNCAGQ